MPHSTSSGSERRAQSQSRTKAPRDASVDSREATTEKFPDFESSSSIYNASPAQRPNGYLNGAANQPGDNWRPRGESSARGARWVPSLSGQPARGHGRQKSINDTLRNIRVRGGSVSQNAHEIAGALRAPISPKLIVWLSHEQPGHLASTVLIGDRRYYVSCGTPPRR